MNGALEKYARRVYLETKIRTASAHTLVFEMLRVTNSRALQLEHAVINGLEPEDWETLALVLDTLDELNSALRPSVDPALCERLSSLYAFTGEMLMTGVATRNVRAVRAARNVVASILEAWLAALAVR